MDMNKSIRHLITLAGLCKAHPGSVLVIGPEDERLLELRAADFGDPVTAGIMVYGVRATFPRLFGAPIEWGRHTQVRFA